MWVCRTKCRGEWFPEWSALNGSIGHWAGWGQKVPSTGGYDWNSLVVEARIQRRGYVGPGLAQLVERLAHRYSENTSSNPGNLTSATVCGDRTGGDAGHQEVSTCSTRGGSPGMYIMFTFAMRIRQPTLALKPRGDVTRNPKQDYQWPQKRTCVRQKPFLKKGGYLSFYTVNLPWWGVYFDLVNSDHENDEYSTIQHFDHWYLKNEILIDMSPFGVTGTPFELLVTLSKPNQIHWHLGLKNISFQNNNKNSLCGKQGQLQNEFWRDLSVWCHSFLSFLFCLPQAPSFWSS